MKIKCKNIYNERSKKFQDQSLWLTIGKEYIVLEVEIYPLEKILYRLVGDNENKMPALYNSSQFEIVIGNIPKNWKIKQLNNTAFILGPGAWQSLDFWDACYEHEPTALEVYRREARAIYEDARSLGEIE